MYLSVLTVRYKIVQVYNKIILGYTKKHEKKISLITSIQKTKKKSRYLL